MPKGPAPLLLASPPTPFLVLHPGRALWSQKNEGSAFRGQKEVPPQSIGYPFCGAFTSPDLSSCAWALRGEDILVGCTYPLALGCWGRAYHQQSLPTNNFLSPDSQPALPNSTNTQ